MPKPRKPSATKRMKAAKLKKKATKEQDSELFLRSLQEKRDDDEAQRLRRRVAKLSDPSSIMN